MDNLAVSARQRGDGHAILHGNFATNSPHHAFNEQFQVANRRDIRRTNWISLLIFLRIMGMSVVK